jgi:aminoglycoside phosphotransferase (APT) family kinase protein
MVWLFCEPDAMGVQNMPAAEIDITAGLVRSLLSEQHPDLAGLAIVEVAHGWDNVMYRIGDDLAVRLPRRAKAARLAGHEQRVLPVLAPMLPLDVPVPLRIGGPTEAYPWAWTVLRWLPGERLADSVVEDALLEARRLGEFMAALHVPAPDDAPPNPYRGHFIGNNTPIVAKRLEALVDDSAVDAVAVLDRWHELVDDVEPFALPAAWIHGDLHAMNVLVHDGAFSAVIDFGDVCAGDPATDLSCAWAFFDKSARDEFRQATGSGGLGIDEAVWQRAEAWALHFAVIYLGQSADNPTLRRMGEQLIATLMRTELR